MGGFSAHRAGRGHGTVPTPGPASPCVDFPPHGVEKPRSASRPHTDPCLLPPSVTLPRAWRRLSPGRDLPRMPGRPHEARVGSASAALGDVGEFAVIGGYSG